MAPSARPATAPSLPGGAGDGRSLRPLHTLRGCSPGTPRRARARLPQGFSVLGARSEQREPSFARVSAELGRGVRKAVSPRIDAESGCWRRLGACSPPAPACAHLPPAAGRQGRGAGPQGFGGGATGPRGGATELRGRGLLLPLPVRAPPLVRAPLSIKFFRAGSGSRESPWRRPRRGRCSGGGCWASCLAGPGWPRSWGACPTASAGTGTAGAGGERAARGSGSPCPRLPTSRARRPQVPARSPQLPSPQVPRVPASAPARPPARGGGGPAGSPAARTCPERSACPRRGRDSPTRARGPEAPPLSHAGCGGRGVSQPGRASARGSSAGRGP